MSLFGTKPTDVNRRRFLERSLAAGAATAGTHFLSAAAVGGRSRGSRHSTTPHERRHRDSPVPGGRGDSRDGSLAAIQRAGRSRCGRLRIPGRAERPRRRHEPVRVGQHRRRDQPRDVSECLPRVEGRSASEPGRVPHPSEQCGDRRAADRPADQPDAAHGGYELVDAISQPEKPGSRRHLSTSHPEPERRAAPGDSAQRRRARRSERRDSAHPGDREHRGVSLCLHRAGRQQPLCRDGAEGNQPRGAQDHRQHRAHRDGALPDVARQGRQRAGRDRRRRWSFRISRRGLSNRTSCSRRT